MSYVYANHKHYVFTDEGQRAFLRVRDYAAKAIALAGCVTAGRLLTAAGGSGSSWDHMACVDRLVELGELCEPYRAQDSIWQHRVFWVGRS